MLGYVVLGDVLPRRTVACCAFAIACIALVFASQLGDSDGGDPLGDALAVFTGLTLSVYLLNTRHAARAAPDVPIALAAGCGSCLAAAVVALSTLATGDDILASPRRTPLLFLVLCLDGACVCAIFIGTAIAPKSNLQPDFNVSVFDSFDARLSTVLRELNESDRFVQKSAESTSIRPS